MKIHKCCDNKSTTFIKEILPGYIALFINCAKCGRAKNCGFPGNSFKDFSIAKKTLIEYWNAQFLSDESDRDVNEDWDCSYCGKELTKRSLCCSKECEELFNREVAKNDA
jgi:hypothetical protein